MNLMPNDLIMVDYKNENGEVVFSTPALVTGVSCDGDCDGYDLMYHPFQTCDIRSYEDKEERGIPLTKEILDANGWEGCGLWMQLKANGDAIATTIFDWTIPNKLMHISPILYQDDHHLIDCYYVHQLQQVLRLCGFVEIANNFKIKKGETK